MTTFQATTLGIVILLIVAHSLAMPFVVRRAQPIRERMAELGGDLLASATLEPRWKRVVDSMLDDAFDPTITILVALLYPIYICRRLVGKFSPATPPKDPEMQRKFDEFSDCHTRAIFAANPIFALICFALAFVSVNSMRLKRRPRGNGNGGYDRGIQVAVMIRAERIRRPSHAVRV